ncbi:MAG: PASTA domain-containing protein [Candidatus Eremiobacteraeota bacterium]|nr:PASTA domain-containing protein [Candidatus Eremiobacteraeota bacterium]
MTDWRDRLHEYVPRDWVFPIVLAAFVGVAVWFGHAIYLFVLPPAGTVTVPSFVGQTTSDADAEVARLHLASSVISHVTSDKFPKDVVVDQQPDAGTAVREGRQVSFVVSSGMIVRLMPDLRYQSLREVSVDLARTRLQLGKTAYVKSDVVPEGHVVDQDPAPLVNVGEGDTVDLTLSKGGSASLRVPSFVGMNVDEARAAADKAGLKLGQIVWTPLGFGGPAHGQVARQAPAAGTKVNSYDPVSIQVSSGPHESGYIVRQAHLLVSVPVPDGVTVGTPLKVRLAVSDATGNYDLFNAYAQAGQKFDFTVTSVGSSVVTMFVNGTKVGTTVLGQEPTAVYDEKPKKIGTQP